MDTLMYTREEVMGHVNVIRELGEGEFGLVSLVTYKEVNCCMKESAGEEDNDFVSEAQIMYDVNGAGGVPKVIALSHDGSVFIMEYVEGMTLRDFAYKYAFSTSQLTEMLEKDINHKVKDLHDAGYIHGDIHYENVMVCGTPGKYYVRLIDLGYAEKLVNENVDDDLKAIDSIWFPVDFDQLRKE